MIEFYIFSLILYFPVFTISLYLDIQRGKDIILRDLLFIVVVGLIPCMNTLMGVLGLFSLVHHVVHSAKVFDFILVKGKKQ